MILCPPGDTRLRLIAIDPGTTTLGMTCMEIDLVERYAYVHDVRTLNANRVLNITPQYNHLVALYGEREARLQAHRTDIYHYFQYWTPHAVVAEAPFMGIRPHAYGALVECLSMVRSVALAYSPIMPFETVPPQQAKTAFNVAYKDTRKEDVKRRLHDVLGDPESRLRYIAPQHIDHLDEHSIDAIMVGYFFYLKWVHHNPLI